MSEQASGHRLLVVDDDHDIRLMLAEQLSKVGYSVSTASNGQEMRRTLDREHADLIVLGTHGRRGLKRLVMGSDAEMVLRSSPVPVLMVREEAERE